METNILNEDGNSCENNIVLTEDDIPGARLCKPTEQCSVAILKRWLSCRGAKVTGTKLELIKRVNSYINNDLAGNIVDPDGGINYKKKLAEATGSHVLRTLEENFPTADFQTDLSILPKVRYANIWKYLIEDVELRKQVATEKPLVKGYNFFKSGHVKQAFAKREGGLFYIKSKVLPSMKKGIYSVKVVMDENTCVRQASCDCPAGVDGRCNHLAATLFMLESLEDSENKENRGTREQALTTPCTSRPCTWSVPKRAEKASPIHEMKFVKRWGKKNQQPRKKTRLHEVQHRPVQRDFESFYEKVKKLEDETGMNIGLSYILPHTFATSEQPLNLSSETSANDLEQHDSRWLLVSPNKFLPLSLEEIKAKSERTKLRLLASADNRKEIMEQTVNQHQSEMWYHVRQPRITASRCKRCLIKPTTSPTKAIADILNYQAPIQTQAMKDGIASEAGIIKRYELITGNIVSKSGFCISPTHPFLGASPDGITAQNTLVEVKKVNSREGETFDETLCRLLIYKQSPGGLELNRNHKYHYQIQQQLFCTGYKLYHFVVSNGTWVHIDEVCFDEVFWSTTLEKLETFYFEHIFPELVYPNVKFGCRRWGKVVPFPS